MKESIYIGLLVCLFIFSFFFSILHESIYISIFFLILTFLISSLLFILSGVEFVGFLYLIVYVGAVAVLFLFMVMLFDRTEYLIFNRVKYSWESKIYNLVAVFFISYLITSFFGMSFNLSSNLNFFYFATENFFVDYRMNFIFGSNIELLGALLYGYFVWCFVGASLVLLLGMVGTIFLTQNGVFEKHLSYHHQDIKLQLMHRNL